jgi:Ca2+/H+ antiporter, TMEM165/GDT1 family
VTGSQVGLMVTVALASAVEFVEAFTVVLAMGLTRGWRATLWGTGVAILVLALVTAVAGYAMVEWVPESAIQFAIGTLLLIFGLQWLRKAILRSAGLKALHDEEQTFLEEREAARQAGDERKLGLDWFGFVVSFKAVFLEGLEVVFIVITFGLNADSIPLAAAGAAGAGGVVLLAGALMHKPLSRVPENTIKYAVGLLLATFGTFWAAEGLGVFTESQESLEWPGGDWAIPALLALWLTVSRMTVVLLRRMTLRPVAEAA